MAGMRSTVIAVDSGLDSCGLLFRLVQIAFLSGSKAQVDFMRLMLKRLVVTGSTLRSASSREKVRNFISEVFSSSKLIIPAVGSHSTQDSL